MKWEQILGVLCAVYGLVLLSLGIIHNMFTEQQICEWQLQNIPKNASQFCRDFDKHTRLKTTKI